MNWREEGEDESLLLTPYGILIGGIDMFSPLLESSQIIPKQLLKLVLA